MGYQGEFIAVPQAFQYLNFSITKAYAHDGSSPLPVRVRVHCDTPADYDALLACTFEILGVPSNQFFSGANESSICTLTKQCTPDREHYQTQSQANKEYKDFTIDVQNIAQSMMSHDLPLASPVDGAGNTVVNVDIGSGSYPFRTNTLMLQVCTMNNIALTVRVSYIYQNLSNGDIVTANDLNFTNNLYSNFIVGNSVNDLDNKSSFTYTDYMIGTSNTAKFLNKQNNTDITQIGVEKLANQVTMRPRDEASLYGFCATPQNANLDNVIIFNFVTKNGSAPIDSTIVLNMYDLIDNNFSNQLTKGAGTFFQFSVGLKTLIEVNKHVKARAFNDDLVYYTAYFANLDTSTIGSEVRWFLVGKEPDGQTAWDGTIYGNDIVVNGGFSSTANFTLTSTTGTKGFDINNGLLSSLSNSDKQKIEFTGTADLTAGALYKMTYDIYSNANADATVAILTGNNATGFDIPQITEGGLKTNQELLFVASTTGKLALSKTPSLTACKLDNIRVQPESKHAFTPRQEAYPKYRVFWLNRLGGMDWYDFSAEYKEEMDIKRTMNETALDYFHDPLMKSNNRNSYTGGLHQQKTMFIEDESEFPTTMENVAGFGTYGDPLGGPSYVNQTDVLNKYRKPHQRNTISHNTEVKVSYRLSSGLIPTYVARDLEDCLTSNAHYIQKWDANGNVYLDPCNIRGGKFTIVDEEQKVIRLDITLERARIMKTQHGM